MRNALIAQSIYSTLLLLFPSRFQHRFGAEMAQVFLDSWRLSAAKRGLPGVLSFWFRTLHDLTLSVVREWGREIDRDDCEVDVTGLADAFMITVVVGTLLSVWGWTASRFALFDATLPRIIFAAALAILLGVLSALFVARRGRTYAEPD